MGAVQGLARGNLCSLPRKASLRVTDLQRPGSVLVFGKGAWPVSIRVGGLIVELGLPNSEMIVNTAAKMTQT